MLPCCFNNTLIADLNYRGPNIVSYKSCYVTDTPDQIYTCETKQRQYIDYTIMKLQRCIT